jgi:hypothetical protein
MDPTPIKWPLSTSPGIRPQENEGRLINCYAEPAGDDGSKAIYYRSAGVNTYLATTGPTTTGVFRGAILVGSILYCVFGTQVWTFTAGVFNLVGTVAGTDNVFFARNFASPNPNIVLVCQAGAFVVTTISITAYPDIDVGSPTCVVGHQGFIIFGYGDGTMLSTDINSTNINTLNAAATTTNPDGIVQIISYSGWVYVMGTATVEVWGEPINGTGFPLTRSGFNFTPGILNDHAVAGFEPEFGQPPIYVGSDYTVRQINGYTPTDISPPELRRLIKISVDSNNNIIAFVYVIDGTPFCQIDDNTVFSWVYDGANGNWHERQSYLLTYSRLTGSIPAFQTWLVGDTKANGRFLEIASKYRKEINDPLIATLESVDVAGFPINVGVPRADFEFTTGVGNAQGHDPDETNPQVIVYWSDNSGVVWKGPRFVPLGRQSNSLVKATVWRTGLSGPQGRRWKLDVPAAVHMGFVGGNMTALPIQYP